MFQFYFELISFIHVTHFHVGRAAQKVPAGFRCLGVTLSANNTLIPKSHSAFMIKVFVGFQFIYHSLKVQYENLVGIYYNHKCVLISLYENKNWWVCVSVE